MTSWDGNVFWWFFERNTMDYFQKGHEFVDLTHFGVVKNKFAEQNVELPSLMWRSYNIPGQHGSFLLIWFNLNASMGK